MRDLLRLVTQSSKTKATSLRRTWLLLEGCDRGAARLSVMDSRPTLGGSSGELRASRILKMIKLALNKALPVCDLPASRFFTSYQFIPTLCRRNGIQFYSSALRRLLSSRCCQLHWCLWPKRWTGARLPRNGHSEHHHALRGRMFSGALAFFFVGYLWICMDISLLAYCIVHTAEQHCYETGADVLPGSP